MNRVVITGIGIISCLGNDKTEVLDSLLQSKSGISTNQDYIDNGMPINDCECFWIVFGFRL